jgi:hypothetical protein
MKPQKSQSPLTPLKPLKPLSKKQNEDTETTETTEQEATFSVVDHIFHLLLYDSGSGTKSLIFVEWRSRLRVLSPS